MEPAYFGKWRRITGEFASTRISWFQMLFGPRNLIHYEASLIKRRIVPWSAYNHQWGSFNVKIWQRLPILPEKTFTPWLKDHPSKRIVSVACRCFIDVDSRVDFNTSIKAHYIRVSDGQKFFQNWWQGVDKIQNLNQAIQKNSSTNFYFSGFIIRINTRHIV